ncbi:hypothetical protein SDC9_107447 [bioreactor metagenome]|uniref:Uncharacterized protein n=1 Tax=bioreactor metagenome TaxID=1076179 RepID=A0A645B587_9ZZZZ
MVIGHNMPVCVINKAGPFYLAGNLLLLLLVQVRKARESWKIKAGILLGGGCILNHPNIHHRWVHFFIDLGIGTFFSHGGDILDHHRSLGNITACSTGRCGRGGCCGGTTRQ